MLSRLNVPTSHDHAVFDRTETSTSPMYLVVASVAVLAMATIALLITRMISLVLPAFLGYLRVSGDNFALESSHIVTPHVKAMMYT